MRRDYPTVLDLVGGTPLVRLQRLGQRDDPLLLAKLEYMNPGGSVKDRIGLRMIEERASALDAEARNELLHAVGAHHDMRAARTAEAAVLYHANQLDAVAATRPVTTE